MAMMLVVLLAAAATLWMYAPRPQPVKVRRNLLQEELLEAYSRADR